MNQKREARLADIRQNPRRLDFENDEDWKIFLALLDEREEREIQERAGRAKQAQANQGRSPSSPTPGSSSAAATNTDHDDHGDGDNEDENSNENEETAASLSLRTKIKEEQADSEDKDVKLLAPDPTAAPTDPNQPLTAPSGERIYFFYGTYNIPLVLIHPDIQTAVQKLIEMYIARNRLAGSVDVCIHQRYDGRPTDNVDGPEYACGDCIDKYRDGQNYRGYRVCIRHGRKAVDGQMVYAYFAVAQKRTENQRLFWRSE